MSFKLHADTLIAGGKHRNQWGHIGRVYHAIPKNWNHVFESTWDIELQRSKHTLIIFTKFHKT